MYLLPFLLPALASAAALPGLQTFTLHAPYPAASPLPSSGSLSWLGTGTQSVGGHLGWWNSDAPHTSLTAFIQYNKKEGIAFDATNTARTMYLKAPRADGLREVELGNPQMEPQPDQTLETNFTISATMVNPGQPDYWLGYLWKQEDMWSACLQKEGWRLLFGKVQGEPSTGCTNNFWLEVRYVGGNPPCC
ncbi:hypothetical protein BDD12DRAFT_897815 [Trichophaea hybrida]|nr:hypothetical protein BDD12DRAFT_897815 [Trichophaea hybrida]